MAPFPTDRAPVQHFVSEHHARAHTGTPATTFLPPVYLTQNIPLPCYRAQTVPLPLRQDVLEPGSLLLLTTGAVTLWWLKRRHS